MIPGEALINAHGDAHVTSRGEWEKWKCGVEAHGEKMERWPGETELVEQVRRWGEEKRISLGRLDLVGAGEAMPEAIPGEENGRWENDARCSLLGASCPDKAAIEGVMVFLYILFFILFFSFFILFLFLHLVFYSG